MEFIPGKLYRLTQNVLMIEKDWKTKDEKDLGFYEQILREGSVIMFIEEIPNFWGNEDEEARKAKVFLDKGRLITSDWTRPDDHPEEYFEEVKS